MYYSGWPASKLFLLLLVCLLSCKVLPDVLLDRLIVSCFPSLIAGQVVGPGVYCCLIAWRSILMSVSWSAGRESCDWLRRVWHAVEHLSVVLDGGCSDSGAGTYLGFRIVCRLFLFNFWIIYVSGQCHALYALCLDSMVDGLAHAASVPLWSGKYFDLNR